MRVPSIHLRNVTRFIACIACVSAPLLPGDVSLCRAAGPAGGHVPSLLLTPERIAELKRRISTVPWVADSWRDFLHRADAGVARPVALPPYNSNWYHWYVCPEHGNRLEQGRKIGEWQWEHICPVDQKVFRGDRTRVETDYDGCAISRVHADFAGMLRDCGIAYQVTGEVRYAKKAAEILLAYAEKYPDYPLHTTRNEAKIGGGRVGPQTLDESTWLIPVCQGADLIWATLAREERQRVTDRLLRPAAREVILPHRMAVHNIQCWKNSAVGLVGFLIQDEELIRAAIDDPKSGFRVQVAKGVGEDGLWWEGAWGYHFYTMSALWPLAEASLNRGIDLYTGPYRRMFDAPLALAMPDGVLPDFNDSGKVDLNRQNSLYELAFARYGEREYVPILKAGGRKDLTALLFGVDPLPEASVSEAVSANHPASGYAILTRGKGADATWLCLDYGPHGGGHGHPDKLGFVLYTGGAVLAPDAGITSYGSRLHGDWFRTTIAHNTLCIDGENQRPSEGTCLAFGSERGIDFVMADAGKIHDGVRFVRTAMLVDEKLLVFVDHIRSETRHTLDIAYHQRGKWTRVPDGSAWEPPDRPGYRHLQGGSAREVRESSVLMARLEGGGTASVNLMGGESTELITATGIGASTSDRVPTAIFRRSIDDTAFVWAVALDGRPVELRRLEVSSDDEAVVSPAEAAAFELTWGQARRYVLSNPDEKARRVRLPDGRDWSLALRLGIK